MSLINKDTIVAQATPPGRGGIGILRVSGLQTRNVAKMILGKLPRPRYADYLLFKDVNGSPLDKGIALWFPKPNSFTGEDVLELHGHGGQIVLDLLLKNVLTLPDVRIANPGEFSERAFLNEKLDLTQAEAIADLIDASSEQAVRAAMNSLHGAFSTRVKHLMEKLTYLRAHIEACINFPEEVGIDSRLEKVIITHLNEMISHLETLNVSTQQGYLLREGARVVIVGSPNVGKSSLLNMLIGRESAIVTNIAGTTRDVLCEHMYIDGLPLHILDTAGLRDPDNEVERIGIIRAWQEIERADHVLLMIDSTTGNVAELEKIWPDNFTARFPENLSFTVIRNKIDMTDEKPGFRIINGYNVIFLSARTGEGLDVLRNFLKEKIGYNNIEGNFLARRRHFQALLETTNHLKQGRLHFINDSWDSNLLSEELRLAQLSLTKIIGDKLTSNDLLDEIFSNFCIGK